MKYAAFSRGAAAAALLLAAGVASAGQVVANRGYLECIDDLEGAYSRHAGLVHARYYLHATEPQGMTYYVNSTAWQDGDRVPLRTRCRTDRVGRDVVSLETELGRWIQSRARVRVEEVSGR